MNGIASELLRQPEAGLLLESTLKKEAPLVTGLSPVHRAMLAAANCGVALLATIHAADVAELKRKPLFAQLLKLRVFERAVTITRWDGQRRYEVTAL